MNSVLYYSGDPVLTYIKVNVNLEQTTKAQRASRCRAVIFFFNFGGRCGWVVSATLRPFYSRECLGTHCVGVWVSPRAGLDGCERSRHSPGFDPYCFICFKSVLSSTSMPASVAWCYLRLAPCNLVLDCLWPSFFFFTGCVMLVFTVLS